MSLYCNPITDNLEGKLCGPKRGGLNGVIYVANLSEIASITSSTNDKVYDAITMNVDPITTNPYYWFQISFKKNSAGLNNEGQFGNNIFVNQSISFTVEGITATSLQVLTDMLDGEAVFIAKDWYGETHLLGRVGGLSMSAIGYGTGAAGDDLYGGEITFSSEEPELSNLIASGTTIDVWDGSGTVTVTL